MVIKKEKKIQPIYSPTLVPVPTSSKVSSFKNSLDKDAENITRLTAQT